MRKLFYLTKNSRRILCLFLIPLTVLCGCAAGEVSKESVAVSDENQTDEISEETTKPVTDLKDKEELWGTFTPDTSAENNFVKEIKKIRQWDTGTVTQTYAADYDGNGKTEAFVFCGEYGGSEFLGDLWFVDEEGKAVCMTEDMYAFTEQVYYKDFQQIYLLFSHNIGNPTATEIYTVKDGQAVNIAENLPGQKWVDENGLLIVVQESYDAFFDKAAGEEGLWTGHTWKFYPFYFEEGNLTEVEAWETDLETAEKIAALPEEVSEYLTDTNERKVAATQFFYRKQTRELIINIAYDFGDKNNQSYSFENLIYRLPGDTAKSWEFAEANKGIYARQYTRESFWEFTDGIERSVPEGKEYVNAYLNILHMYRNAYPEQFEELLCDLIFVDEDEVPELIIGKSGYWISMYAYKDGTVHELMDMWAYGAGGNAGYEYIPYENIMRNYNSDYAGYVLYTSYASINENYNFEESSYYLKMSYEDENGEVIMDEDALELDESNWHYYYKEREISKEEYNSYIINSENFEYINGSQSYYSFEDYLCHLLDETNENNNVIN